MSDRSWQTATPSACLRGDQSKHPQRDCTEIWYQLQERTVSSGQMRKKSYYPHCGGQIACKPHSPFWMVTMSANLEAAGRPDPISKHKHFCLGFGWGLCTALPTPTSPHPLLIGWDHQNLEDTDVTDSFPREHIHAHLLPPTRLFIYPQGLHLILVRK